MAKVFLAVPTYGQIDCECVSSIFNNIQALHNAGHQVRLVFEQQNSLIADARNKLADTFLKSDCDTMVFIDTDLVFEGEAILRLVMSERDIVGGVYPKKSTEHTSQLVQFPTNFMWGEDKKPKIVDRNLIEAFLVPTGLMKIKRRVFNRFKDKYPENQAKDYVFCFFLDGLIPPENEYAGEDAYFCHKIRMMGGRLFIYPNINFKHIGRKPYPGNLHEFLVNPEKFIPKEIIHATSQAILK